MATVTLIPLSEYLTTAYRPDRDWIDGEIKERHVGEGSHSSVQGFLIEFFRVRQQELSIRAWPEQRVQVAPNRFRVPDLCLTRRTAPFEEIITTPPLLCIEILSRDDRMADILDRVEDYFTMGVTAVWVIEPRRRRAFAAGPGGSLTPIDTELTVDATGIRVPVPAIFAELDELEAQP